MPVSSVRADAEKMVAESCARQGLPIEITDPAVIAQVATALAVRSQVSPLDASEAA